MIIFGILFWRSLIDVMSCNYVDGSERFVVVWFVWLWRCLRYWNVLKFLVN